MDGAALPSPRRVLFVCINNAGRSQMAEAFARLHGAGYLEAASAGPEPAERVCPAAALVMREAGYNLMLQRPKGLEEVVGPGLDLVVGMGCGEEKADLLPARQYLEWGVPNPRGLENLRGVRDVIEDLVKELVRQIRTEARFQKEPTLQHDKA